MTILQSKLEIANCQIHVQQGDVFINHNSIFSRLLKKICNQTYFVTTFKICPLIPQQFCVVYDYVDKADLSKGYQNLKRKLEVITHFSEIIELKFGKKFPYILCILALFWNYGCLIISEKCVVTHIFLFGFQSPLLRSTFSP